MTIACYTREKKEKSMFAAFKVLLVSIFFLMVACSEPKEITSKTNPTETPKIADTPTLIKPKMGEISVVLQKGWIVTSQPQPKETEVLSYIRKVDQKLWSNPGPAGTGNLPVMSLTVTLRDAKASRADLDPKKLGNGLVKQGVFTQLIRAEEIKVADLSATIVVGDSPDRGRTSIIMLPHNGFLYKWTLDGTKETDMEVNGDLEAFLDSAKLNKTN
ncbi:MAG: hypothetical protein IPK14_00900 [Blastocatellia bacterium]|nr:hypothetical protein [Blastocatellia bacterium]